MSDSPDEYYEAVARDIEAETGRTCSPEYLRERMALIEQQVGPVLPELVHHVQEILEMQAAVEELTGQPVPDDVFNSDDDDS